MATESSTIARLVDAAKKRGMPGPGGAFEPMEHHSDPVSPKGARPSGKQSGGSSWWLLFVAVIVIGGSVVGGYVLAQQQGEQVSAGAEVAQLGSVAIAAGDAARIDPWEVAASTVMPPVPASADAAAPVDEIDEELEPTLGDEEMALAGKTGFDILVEPKGAEVTLDGQPIGGAPMRVSNLLPGTHRIDIEGPDGYFGQHQEFTLAAGEAMVLRLSLEMLDPTAPDSESAPADVKQAQEQSRRERRKARREARKRSSRTSTSQAKKGTAPNASEEKDLAEAGSVSLGTLMLGAKPPCEISINGKKTGLTTPQRSMQLPEGTHRVVLVNKEQGVRKSFKVRIKSGRTTRAIQDLTK
ncbi:MAG: PEGA domain-containing protein [Myxococcales bacterium]|nr:PEGA domain-containing protein [Myxococcales bacterium]